MIFLDTSFLVAYIVDKDTNHEIAVSLMKEIVEGEHGSAITSEYVFDETVTVVLVRSRSLETAVKTGDIIKESIPVLDVGNNVFEASWKRFRNQRNAKFSFTDCTILEMVESNHLDKLATFDREFEGADNFEVLS